MYNQGSGRPYFRGVWAGTGTCKKRYYSIPIITLIGIVLRTVPYGTVNPKTERDLMDFIYIYYVPHTGTVYGTYVGNLVKER